MSFTGSKLRLRAFFCFLVLDTLCIVALDMLAQNATRIANLAAVHVLAVATGNSVNANVIIKNRLLQCSLRYS